MIFVKWRIKNLPITCSAINTIRGSLGEADILICCQTNMPYINQCSSDDKSRNCKIYFFLSKCVLITRGTTKTTPKIPSHRITVNHEMLQRAYQYKLTRFQWLPCNIQLVTDYTQIYYHIYKCENSKFLNSEHINACINTRSSEF
jgi:hypothetical protein